MNFRNYVLASGKKERIAPILNLITCKVDLFEEEVNQPYEWGKSA